MNHSTDPQPVQQPKYDESTIVIGRLIPPGEKIRSGKRYVSYSTWMVQVICPFCQKKHWHGWEEPGEVVRIRTRTSHCAGLHGYTIFLEGEQTQ